MGKGLSSHTKYLLGLHFAVFSVHAPVSVVCINQNIDISFTLRLLCLMTITWTKKYFRTCSETPKI